jgi:hypothetical protein
VTPEQTKKQNENDLTWLMESPNGRRFIRRLLNTTGYWRSGFNQTEQATHFTEGMRHIGAVLYNEIDAICPTWMIELLKERQNERQDVPQVSETFDLEY